VRASRSVNGEGEVRVVARERGARSEGILAAVEGTGQCSVGEGSEDVLPARYGARMAEITGRFRYPLDGMFTQSLIKELEGITSVEVIRPLEQRGGPLPGLDEVSREIVLTIARTVTQAGVEDVVAAVRS